VQSEFFSSDVPIPLVITHCEACVTLPLIHTCFVICVMCAVHHV
jgi:hypothetical protein